MSTVEFKYELGQDVAFSPRGYNVCIGGNIRKRSHSIEHDISYEICSSKERFYNVKEYEIFENKAQFLNTEAEGLEAQARAKRAEAERLGEAE